MKLPNIIDEIYDAGCFNITDISLLSDSNSIPNVPGESLYPFHIIQFILKTYIILDFHSRYEIHRH